MKYQKLTKVEEEVMQLIWEQDEPSTVTQMIQKLPKPHPPHSTISSIVRILQKKQFVSYKAYGRTHVYFPIIQRKEYKKFSLKGLVSNYFEGSMNELVSFLVEENDLSLKDLSQIVKKLEEE